MGALLLRYCAIPKLGCLARTIHPNQLEKPADRFDLMALAALLRLLELNGESLAAMQLRVTGELSKVKHDRPYGAGRACNKHAIIQSASDAAVNDGAAASASASAASLPPRKRRRAQSDPGEHTITTGTRMRALTYAVKRKPPLVQTSRKKSAPHLSSSSSSLDEIHSSTRLPRLCYCLLLLFLNRFLTDVANTIRNNSR
jgi:hypothetical protein